MCGQLGAQNRGRGGSLCSMKEYLKQKAAVNADKPILRARDETNEPG